MTALFWRAKISSAVVQLSHTCAHLFLYLPPLHTNIKILCFVHYFTPVLLLLWLLLLQAYIFMFLSIYWYLQSLLCRLYTKIVFAKLPWKWCTLSKYQNQDYYQILKHVCYNFSLIYGLNRTEINYTNIDSRTIKYVYLLTNNLSFTNI